MFNSLNKAVGWEVNKLCFVINLGNLYAPFDDDNIQLPITILSPNLFLQLCSRARESLAIILTNVPEALSNFKDVDLINHIIKISKKRRDDILSNLRDPEFQAATNGEKWSSLNYCIQFGYFDFVNELIDRGVDVNFGSDKPLTMACRMDYSNVRL